MEALRQGVVVQDLHGHSVVWFTGVQGTQTVQPVWLFCENRVDQRVVDEVQTLLLLVPKGRGLTLLSPEPLKRDVNLWAAAPALLEVPRDAVHNANDNVEHHHHAEDALFSVKHTSTLHLHKQQTKNQQQSA